jgi:hypothetical protein
MMVNLFLHGSYYTRIEIPETLPCLVLPVYQPRLEAGGLLAFFLPVPGTARTIWECIDPRVALRAGRLMAAAEEEA